MTSDVAVSYGSTTVTVFTQRVEELRQRINIIKITPPTNASSKNDTTIVDLLVMERRLTIDGRIDFADRSNLNTIFTSRVTQATTHSITYLGSTINGMIEKLVIREAPENQTVDSVNPATLQVTFTFLEGVGYGSS